MSKIRYADEGTPESYRRREAADMSTGYWCVNQVESTVASNGRLYVAVVASVNSAYLILLFDIKARTEVFTSLLNRLNHTDRGFAFFHGDCMYTVQAEDGQNCLCQFNILTQATTICTPIS